MGQATPQSGVFALRWDQTEIDGVSGLHPGWLRVGASWTWRGTGVRLDGAPSALRLQGQDDQMRLLERARAIAARLSGDVVRFASIEADTVVPDNGFMLTDGTTCYVARLVARDTGWLVAFEGAVPRPGETLWVMACKVALAKPSAQDVICFTTDAMIATPKGPVPIAQLKAGDKVVTRDNGPRPVLWVGQTTLSGLALRQHPRLRPIRLRRNALLQGLPGDDLCVSPAHRIVVSGPKARALFNAEEVFVRALDLVNFQTILPDAALHGVTYVHLLFDAHQIIYANGVPTESFHPGLAPEQTLRHHRHALTQIAPEWVAAPDSYGPAARRCLSPGEAALLAA
jgi:hypothetical protein